MDARDVARAAGDVVDEVNRPATPVGVKGSTRQRERGGQTRHELS